MPGHGPSDWIRKEQRQLKHMSTELIKAATSKAPSPAPGSLSSSPAPIYDFAWDFVVPEALAEGTTMTKISEKKKRRVLFQLDPDEGRILYKSKKAGIVALETIKEIRSGPAARYHRQQFAYPEDAEARWLTLIYILDGAYKTLHILADTPEVFRMWDASVRKLVAIRQGLMAGVGDVEMREAVWERQYWKGADIERDNRLSFEEVEKLCRRLNAAQATPQLRSLFNSADVTNKGYLEFAEFQVFVKALKRRPEIEDIYMDLQKANGGQFDFMAFEKFMRGTQHSRLSQNELEAVFARYSTPASPSPDTPPVVDTTSKEPIADLSLEDKTSATLSLQGFSSFLLSTDNAVFSDIDREICQDMTRPISEYFISSSHNTYLVGHQLVGVSTVEGYIRALLHSCRSVELDIYDGDTEPVIFHGKTLTSKVSVRDVCNAIAKYAFVTSPYPVLISAEVHCGVQQQDVLVDIMLEAFGEALIQAPPEGRPRINYLPSPEDLKGKVLVKAKNLYVVAQLEALRTKKVAATSAEKSRVLELEAALDSSDDESSNDASADGGIRDEIKTGLVELKDKWRRVRGKDKNEPSTVNHKVKMSFALISLIVYTVGVKCRGLGKELGYAPEHIFSLSENKANNMLKAKVTMRELVRHTRTHMVRVYPKGTRVNSTNYEPHRFWAAGAQLVAINWQTFDPGYTMNQAMFQRNGRAGYILKPDALRGEDEELLSRHTKHVLEVTIISAHQLPRLRDSTGQEVVNESIMDPLVQVSLHIPDWTHSPFEQSTTSLVSLPLPSSAPASASSPLTHAARSHTLSERTRAVKNNGFNPVWCETLHLPFELFGGVSMRELVFVQFSVLENYRENAQNDPIAVYCTPLASLEQGYRHLPLHDAQLSQYLFSTLLVQVQIRDVE